MVAMSQTRNSIIRSYTASTTSYWKVLSIEFRVSMMSKHATPNCSSIQLKRKALAILAYLTN